ncbi:MAG: hypothetical protein JST26_08945 [Bacteroidetes bacterium]|nr:hypothetical protein [Bacteroidota bacterium]
MKTASYIDIPEPCQVPWDSMEPGDESRFCKTCQTPVVDFSKKSLDEIQAFFREQASGASVCGRYNVQHTNQAGKSVQMLNRFEMQIKHPFLKKMILAGISCLLVLSGCVRHVQGKLRAYDDVPSKKQRKQHARSISGSPDSKR